MTYILDNGLTLEEDRQCAEEALEKQLAKEPEVNWGVMDFKDEMPQWIADKINKAKLRIAENEKWGKREKERDRILFNVGLRERRIIKML